MSDYFKIVTHFTNLAGQNKSINDILLEIKSFKPRKASSFSEVETYEELLIAQSEEEDNLNKEYLLYSNYFDKINTEMVKMM